MLTSYESTFSRVRHYFEIDTDVVFRTIEEDIPAMKPVVEKMIKDLRQE